MTFAFPCRFGLLAILAFAGLAACEKTPRLQALAPDDVILAFGDSLTYGTGVKAASSYPQVLAELTGRKVVRSGIPGETSAKGRERLAETLAEHQPALVLLLHGGNDFLRKLPKEELEANLLAMIQQIRAANAQVVLIAVPQLGLLLNDSPLYARVADQADTVIVADALSELLADQTMKSDTIHLNAPGYRALAQRIAETLADHGALPPR